MEKEQIGKFEFLTIIVLYILANDIVRALYYTKHKNNTWILVVVGVIVSCLIIYFYMFLYKNFQYKSFNEIIEKILGKYLSKIIFIIYPIYFIFTSAFNLRDMSELVKIYLIDQAPLYVIGSVFMIVVFYGLCHSIEVISRVTIIFFFFVEFIFVFFSILSIVFNEPKFINLYPIFDDGFKPILIDSLKYSYAIPLGELFVLVILFQFISQKKQATKIFYFGVFQAGLMLLILTILNITIVPPENVVVDYSVVLRISRTIDIEMFIQRIDLLVINVFALHIFTKISVLLFISKYLLSQVKTIKREKIFYFILSAIIVYLSVNFVKNYEDLINIRKKYMFNTVRLIFEIIIPFSLVFLSFLRKPRKKKNQIYDDVHKNKQDVMKDKKDKNILTNIKNKFNKKVLKKS